MDRKIDDLNPILSKITRQVAAIKSLRFALFPEDLIDNKPALVQVVAPYQMGDKAMMAYICHWARWVKSTVKPLI